jgi:hypothetical protein
VEDLLAKRLYVLADPVEDLREAKFAAIHRSADKAAVDELVPCVRIDIDVPLTTLRTMDLRGKKIHGLLFSGFWAETRNFLEGEIAPKMGQSGLSLPPVAIPDRAR